MKFHPNTYDAIKWFWRKYARLHTETVYINNEKNVYFTNKIKSDKIIIMLHGITADKYMWAIFSKKFTNKGYKVIIPDIPPFGESDYNPNIKYTINYQAENLKKFMEKLNIKQAHISGNSMGGGIAAKFSIEFPQFTKSLILFDNLGIYSVKRSEFLKELEKGNNLMLINNQKEFEKMLSLVYYKVPPIPCSVKKELTELNIKAKEKNKKVFDDLLKEEWNLEKELDKINVPALVIWGENDKVFDAETVEVLKKIKNVKIKIIKKCGHMPMNEKPFKTSSKVLEFLKSLD